MTTSTRYNGPADPSTPCDKCSGPTYTFASGSIWCPSEACEPGGHFVRRVAFERKPGATPLPRLAAKPRVPTTVRPRVPAPAAPASDGFDSGFDAFVKGDR